MLRDTEVVGLRRITSVVNPAKSDESEIPARIKRSTPSPVPVRDSDATSSVAPSEAKNATAEYAGCGMPAAIASAMAKRVQPGG